MLMEQPLSISGHLKENISATNLEGLEGTSAEGHAISKSRTRQRPSSESYTNHTKEQADYKKDIELDNPKEHEIKKNVATKNEQKCAEGSKSSTSQAAAKVKNDLRPIRHPLNEKQEKIAQGNVRRRTDYPTMDDVASDWGTEDDEREQDKKKQTRDERGKTPKK